MKEHDKDCDCCDCDDARPMTEGEKEITKMFNEGWSQSAYGEALDLYASAALQGLLARNSAPKNGMTLEETAFKIAKSMIDQRNKYIPIQYR